MRLIARGFMMSRARRPQHSENRQPLGSNEIERNPNRCPTHPGKLPREYVVPATKKKEAEIARDLGISPQHFQDILFERKPVSSEVAESLAKQFGNGQGLWLRIQAAYDEWQALRSVRVSETPKHVVKVRSGLAKTTSRWLNRFIAPSR